MREGAKESRMKMRVRNLCVVLLAVVLLDSPVIAVAGSPLETIQGQVKKVLGVLRDPSLKSESAKEDKEERLWELAGDIFDYTELSRRTLGRNWKKLNTHQQEEFVALFSRLLRSVYMDRIMAYTDEKVVFEKETMFSERNAEVQSKIITSSADIPIRYRMILRRDEWRVYDVLIEGISLVKNYRSQFGSMLTNKTPEYLIEALRKKVG